MSSISDFQRQLITTAALVGPSTVSIGRDHRGAGVVVADGRVLTNAHNLRDRTVQVTFEGGRAEQATVVGVDTARDLVVLDVDTTGAAPISWADAPVDVGAFVVAASRDGAGARVTIGTVSQASRSFRGPGGRPITSAVEHTAPLARGSSGGPVTDLDGRLIAVNTHRLGKGFTAAQPATAELRAAVDELSEGRSRRPLTLGVEVAPPHVARKLRDAVGLGQRDGLLVRGVVEGGPAAVAGIRRGDLLVAAAGRSLGSPDDLFAALAAHDASVPLVVRVVRGVEELEVEVVFAAPTDSDASEPDATDD